MSLFLGVWWVIYNKRCDAVGKSKLKKNAGEEWEGMIEMRDSTYHCACTQQLCEWNSWTKKRERIAIYCVHPAAWFIWWRHEHTTITTDQQARSGGDIPCRSIKTPYRWVRVRKKDHSAGLVKGSSACLRYALTISFLGFGIGEWRRVRPCAGHAQLTTQPSPYLQPTLPSTNGHYLWSLSLWLTITTHLKQQLYHKQHHTSTRCAIIYLDMNPMYLLLSLQQHCGAWSLPSCYFRLYVAETGTSLLFLYLV